MSFVFDKFNPKNSTIDEDIIRALLNVYYLDISIYCLPLRAAYGVKLLLNKDKPLVVLETEISCREINSWKH